MSFGQLLWRRMAHGFTVMAVVAAVALNPLPVHADNYGSGNYSGDVYGSSTKPTTGSSSGGSSGSQTAASSSQTAESTVVETDSGLQVAINLSDGQTIPATGYYITITPINGQGKTFDKAEIYLDGILAYSDKPDETGTLRWLWDTEATPAQKVKVIVYGPGSGTTTHEFNVTVESKNSTTVRSTSGSDTPDVAPTTDANWPLWLVFGLVGGMLVIAALVLWIIARRRNAHHLPPTTFGPM